MTWKEALEKLDEGLKVAKSEWKESGNYYYVQKATGFHKDLYALRIKNFTSVFIDRDTYKEDEEGWFIL